MNELALNQNSQPPAIITLTTDFGTRDGFVGAMKGVILSINPRAVIVDISHDIAPQQIAQGAFVLASAAPYFPARTIHVAVVDPGVGSARRPIALQIGETFFVAPDNGVLTLVCAKLKTPSPTLALPVENQESELGAVHLNRAEFWLPRVSRTFHGRDIFAPVAAHLSLGVPLAALGDPIHAWAQLALAEPYRAGDQICGQVIYVDRFGNAVTNIGEVLLAGLERGRVGVRVAGRVLRGIAPTYVAVAPGEPLALVSSAEQVEIAVRDGSAADALGIRVGDAVTLSPGEC